MDELDLSILKRRSVHGVLALISRTFVLNLISLVSFVVISSQLAASQLGVYVAVIAIQRVISFFTDFGLGAALVQKKEEITDSDIKTAFTLQSGITLGVFIIVFVFRGLIADFFKLSSSGEMLLLVLVLTIFLSSFKTIPSILLERKVNFQKLVIPQIAESLAFNLVLIILLFRNFGLESFSWAFLVSALIGIPIYYYISPWKPRIGIDKKALGFLRYGVAFQAKNVLATIKDDLLTVILTKFLSFTDIGYIGFAQRLSFFVYRYIVDSVTKVSFSTYSRIQESKEILKTAIEKSLFFISLTMFPLLLGLIATAPYLIEFYSKWNKWEPAVVSIVFFSLNALISSISGILVNVLDATGRVKTTLKLMVFWTTATWILTPILIRIYGYNGVSMASFIISLSVVITIYLVKRVVDFELIKSIYKPAIASVVMFVLVFVFEKMFVTNFLGLAIAIILGGLTYTAIMFLIARNEFMSDVKAVLRKE
jgi:O-antigen/teichoic acid export membrane protein